MTPTDVFTTVIGLDIGDGESAIAYVADTGEGSPTSPATIYRRHRTNERSIVTATARSDEGRRLIGEEAIVATGAVQFSVNFKRPPAPGSLTTPDSVLFAQALLDEFFQDTKLPMEGCVVYLGHPTGWPQDSVDTYAKHFAALGVPVRLMPESQSALVHVRDQHVAGRRAYERVLVVDIGSSTVDCTLVEDLVPRNLAVGADLGCQYIDRRLESEVIANRKESEFVSALKIEGGRDLLLLACRRVKEAYFSDEQLETLAFGRPIDPRFEPIVHPAFLWLQAAPIAALVDEPGGFRDQLRDLLISVREQIPPPDLIVLTGGGSRMGFVRGLTHEVFPDSVVEDDDEPAFSVARGLASNGRHRINIGRFREDIRLIAQEPALDQIVARAAEQSVAAAKAALEAAQSKDPAAAQDLARRLSAGTASGDEVGADSVMAELNAAIDTRLAPRITDTCTRYGIADQALTFDLQLPPMVADKLRQVVGSVASAPSFAESEGLRFLVERVLSPEKPSMSRMDGANVVFAIVGILGRTIPIIVNAVGGRRDKGQVDISSIRIPDGQVTRFTEEVRTHLRRQLGERATDLERYLA